MNSKLTSQGAVENEAEFTQQAQIEGPRWSGLEANLTEMALEMEVKFRKISENKRMLSMSLDFEVKGTRKKVVAFTKAVFLAVDEKPEKPKAKAGVAKPSARRR